MIQHTSQGVSMYGSPASSNDFRSNSALDPLMQTCVPRHQAFGLTDKSMSSTQLDMLMNRHLHAELQRIDDLINDVEMRVRNIPILLARRMSDCPRAIEGTSLRRAHIHRS
jgi:hypothetical protein